MLIAIFTRLVYLNSNIYLIRFSFPFQVDFNTRRMYTVEALHLQLYNQSRHFVKLSIVAILSY